MGRGEFSGKLANLRAVSNSIAPILYAKLYAVGLGRGMPGLPFIVGACIVMCAELLLRAVPKMKCEDDRNKKDT